MAQIETRWITLLQETAISLANETWARQLPFGRNWQRIRFGFLASLRGGFVEATNAATTLNDIKIVAGVAADDVWDNGLMNASSGVGVCFSGSPLAETAATLTAASAFPTQCWTTAAPQAFTFHTEPGGETGQVRLPLAFATANIFYPDGNTDGMKRRGIYVVDITRNQGGGGSLTLDAYSPPTSATTFSPTVADLMDVVNTLNQSIIVNQVTMTRNTLATVALPEVGFGLNTLFIHNSNPAYPLLVYAIAALVFNDTPYSGQGGANWWTSELTDTGTVIPVVSSDLVGGWGWGQANWTLSGTSNLIGDLGMAGTAAGMPFDVFQAYNTSPQNVSSGSISSSFDFAGSGWDGNAVITGTSAFGPQLEFSGTSMGWPWEIFQRYNTSPQNVTSGSLSSSFATAGTGWDGPAIISGTSAFGPQVEQSGTTMGWPWEIFQLYDTSPVTDAGSLASGVLNYGTGWDEAIVLVGTSCARPQWEFSSTSAGWPIDSFEQYFAGTNNVTSNVTVNAGTGWDGPATIN